MARTDFNYRPEIEKTKNEIDEETKDIETEKTSSKSSATTSAVKSTDESKVVSQKDDTNKTATADNPLREAYRAKIKQQALEKFLPGGGDPMKMINPGSDAPPVEQPYDLLDRLAVDKRKADFRVRQQYALPVQSIGQMTQAKNGTFVTVNTKIGRNKKTRIT
jgi:hypothetical protein